MFTFGLMYTAATTHSSKISPAGTIGTMMGVVNGVKWGLGKNSVGINWSLHERQLQVAPEKPLKMASGPQLLILQRPVSGNR